MNKEIQKALDKAMANIRAGGPDKVLISTKGDSVPFSFASRYRVVPQVIFIRNDGWSLAAPGNLYGVAYKLWEGDWIGVLVKPEMEPISVEEFLKRDSEHSLLEIQRRLRPPTPDIEVTKSESEKPDIII